MSKIFHVKTEENLADCGTRPEKVKLSDVGPDSEWQCGKKWMSGEISDAIAQGILTPIDQLRISSEEKDSDEFKQGFVFDKDILCNAISQNRVDKIQLRNPYVSAPKNQPNPPNPIKAAQSHPNLPRPIQICCHF